MSEIKFTPRQIRALQRCEEANDRGACSHWLSHHTAMSVPQISATLRQLKARGLVSDGKENSPYYHCMWSLTEAGKQALAATRSTLPELDAEMGEVEAIHQWRVTRGPMSQVWHDGPLPEFVLESERALFEFETRVVYLLPSDISTKRDVIQAFARRS